MNEELQKTIISAWRSRDGASSINAPLADESELLAFESEFGPIPAEYRWFLANCGGGPVGREWVDTIRELSTTHRKFKEESGDGGWTMSDVFVIGWDGWGNPYGIQRFSGLVLVEDHNFGGIHEMAPSFETFLANGLLKNT